METPAHANARMDVPPAIELRGITKSFGPVVANRDISLQVARGTVHGIVGENGAGKSTLMSILYGLYRADSGDIFINGTPAVIGAPRDALSLGIGMVHQHFMLIENFTVLENIVLGAEQAFALRPTLARARDELARLADTYGLAVDPRALIGDLPVGLRQRVEILKALFRGADTLILDEPTGVLTPGEARELFKILGVLCTEGKTVILITHKLQEIMEITGTVTVLRRGRVVATRQTAGTSARELAQLMVGRDVPPRRKSAGKAGQDAALRIDNLCAHRAGQEEAGARLALDHVSFDVRAGEIVGIAGIAGNGQSELLEILAGMRPAASGSMRVNGTILDPCDGRRDAALMRNMGVAHVPEDRQAMGLVSAFSIFENTILGRHEARDLYRFFYMLPQEARKRARRYIEKYDIRPPDCMQGADKLSGGNQQKIVLSREIEADPDILLVGQPTRGVDIGAIEFIHTRILELRDMGKAILLVSVELDEVQALADRILVMCDGAIVGSCAPDVSDQEIGLMMAGLGSPDARAAAGSRPDRTGKAEPGADTADRRAPDARGAPGQ